MSLLVKNTLGHGAGSLGGGDAVLGHDVQDRLAHFSLLLLGALRHEAVHQGTLCHALSGGGVEVREVGGGVGCKECSEDVTVKALRHSPVQRSP